MGSFISPMIEPPLMDDFGLFQKAVVTIASAITSMFGSRSGFGEKIRLPLKLTASRSEGVGSNTGFGSEAEAIS